ncbi:MAG: lysozyme inhibitor LprI family protein [Proteobacteria bacterium]|nr:lysozyme inhibitor LprI family protein [Pseudomonadota bacterium]
MKTEVIDADFGGKMSTRLQSFLQAAVMGALALALANGATADECDQARTSVEIENCFRASGDRYQHELEALEKAVAARMDAKQTALFSRANSAWNNYRDASCRSAASVYEGGTMQPLAAGGCRTRAIRDRIDELRSLYRDLLEDAER